MRHQILLRRADVEFEDAMPAAWNFWQRHMTLLRSCTEHCAWYELQYMLFVAMFLIMPASNTCVCFRPLVALGRSLRGSGAALRCLVIAHSVRDYGAVLRYLVMSFASCHAALCVLVVLGPTWRSLEWRCL